VHELVLYEGLGYRKEGLLCFFQKFIDIGLFVVPREKYIVSGFYEFTENPFMLDDLGILVDIGTRENGLGKFYEVRIPPDLFQVLAIVQMFSDGKDIDGFVPREKIHHSAVDESVVRIVEIGFREERGNLKHPVFIEENGSENSSFRFYGMWRDFHMELIMSLKTVIPAKAGPKGLPSGKSTLYF